MFYYQGKLFQSELCPLADWSEFFLDDRMEHGGTMMSDQGWDGSEISKSEPC